VYDATLNSIEKKFRTRTMLGSFNCTHCPKQWPSGKIPTQIWLEQSTDRKDPTDRYCTLINCQKCQDCERYAEPDIDVENYVRKVVRAIKLWKGLIQGIAPDNNYHMTGPHDDKRCRGCEKGICQWDA
jgi:hypothetical protein